MLIHSIKDKKDRTSCTKLPSSTWQSLICNKMRFKRMPFSDWTVLCRCCALIGPYSREVLFADWPAVVARASGVVFLWRLVMALGSPQHGKGSLNTQNAKIHLNSVTDSNIYNRSHIYLWPYAQTIVRKSLFLLTKVAVLSLAVLLMLSESDWRSAWQNTWHRVN